MIKKLLLLSGLGLLVIGIIYISIISFRSKPGFPYNILLSPSTASNFEGVDSVLIKATDMYMAGAYRKFILGKNYRKAWDAPIKVPVVWLDTLQGGLTPVKAGGGGQTRSMILENKRGQKFAMRSVCKDAMPSLPTFGKVLKLKNMVIDGVSAGHPYAALAVARLCDAAGILHTQPRLVYVPEQPALDTFNERFANRLFIIEYEQESNNGDWTDMDSVLSTMESPEVMEQLLTHPPHQVDQHTLLHERLFDLMIDDWDRHPGNWGWIAHSVNGKVTYTPFPVDRDMAFYYGSGIGTWIFNRPGAMGKFRRFLSNKNYLKTSFYKARLLDSTFLNELTREDFLQAAKQLQQQLTDEQIQAAFYSWPDTLYQLDAARIIARIIDRRDDLYTFATAFYEHLALEPEIMGTHQKDSFIVHQLDGNQVMVEVYSTTETGKMEHKYKRTFFSDETKAITLFGWKGDDVLYVRGKLSIPINFVGGKGTDRIDPASFMQSKNKLVLFDNPVGIIAPKGYKIKKGNIDAMMPRA